MNEFFPSQAAAAEVKADRTEMVLKAIAQNIIAVVFGFLPLLFIPAVAAPFEYTKVFVVIVAVLLAVIFFSLSVLRSGTLKLALPTALVALWAVAIGTVVSALLSGDMRDAFIGNALGVHTALFIVLLALTSTVNLMVQQTKAVIMRLYMFLTVSAGVLTVFHLLRLIFGANFLSFGLFNDVTTSPIGSWNDLGLLFGLVILLSLVALEQLPLTKWGRIMFSLAVGASLVMLAVVNFVAVWVVLALVSLVVMMYSLSKDRFSSQPLARHSDKTNSFPSIILSIAVFVVSLLFIIAGPTIGRSITNLTNINYIEVRPSLEATVDISKAVYKENAFVGIGPNKFVDAWRLYKDRQINETVFWNTDFVSGNGYITTFFASTGVVGVITWLIFMGSLLYCGYRMLFMANVGDKFWYFIGSSSFVAAIYLWGMFFVHVPGATIVLLAGIFTSLVFVAYTESVPTRSISLSVADNRRSGIVLVGVVMLVIVSSASSLYFVAQHYSSVYSFRSAIASIGDGVNIEAIEQQIAGAYTNNKNDLYARQIAQYQIAKMNALLSVAQPTPEQQQQFQSAAADGINAATLSIQVDETEPLNHATLGTIYGILAAAGVEGSKDRAMQSFGEARKYDPQNPLYVLLEAQVESRTGELETARTLVLESIQLKNNYTDALYLLSQLDIASGNVDEAIQASLAMVSLEPQNAARYYQVGVLYSSQAKLTEAIAAFKRAVEIDPNYANARYFLGLAYVESGNKEAGIAELEVVRDLNPDNAGVQDMINQLRSGEATVTASDFVNAVNEPKGVEKNDNVVTGQEDLDSPLIAPVNGVPDTTEEETSSEDESNN